MTMQGPRATWGVDWRQVTRGSSTAWVRVRSPPGFTMQESDREEEEEEEEGEEVEGEGVASLLQRARAKGRLGTRPTPAEVPR